jgi:hypothetical protein
MMKIKDALIAREAMRHTDLQGRSMKSRQVSRCRGITRSLSCTRRRSWLHPTS